MDARRTSKFLSLILRHEPGKVGLKLDSAGWVEVDALLQGLSAHGHPLSRAELERIVAESDKQRFALSPDGERIRANQGHSVEVELEYTPQAPPPRLFHGTATRFLPAIREQGLLRMSRHHVHLSADPETATAVGSRHGKPVVLTVRADRMTAPFFRSANGVWLTEHVPPEFLEFPEEATPGPA